MTARTRTAGAEPIEMSLLRRHRESQAKMNVVRARYQAEEDKELKPVPEINAFSKAIAIHKAGLVVDRDFPPSMGAHTDRPGMKPPVYSIHLDEMTMWDDIEESMNAENTKTQENLRYVNHMESRKTDCDLQCEPTDDFGDIRSENYCSEWDDEPEARYLTDRNEYEERPHSYVPRPCPKPRLDLPVSKVPSLKAFQANTARDQYPSAPLTDRSNFRSNTMAERPASQDKPKASMRHFSPTTRVFSYRAGFNVGAFYKRAEPVVIDYKNPIKRN